MDSFEFHRVWLVRIFKSTRGKAATVNWHFDHDERRLHGGATTRDTMKGGTMNGLEVTT